MGSLYENIKSLCDVRGIKPATMCREAGVNPNLPTDLKSGRKKSLKVETAQKIADYFGISVADLLGQKEKPSIDEGLEEYFDMIRNRPEMRLLLKANKRCTAAEVLENIEYSLNQRQKHD